MRKLLSKISVKITKNYKSWILLGLNMVYFFVRVFIIWGFEKDLPIWNFFVDLKKIWWFVIILWIWKRFVDCKFCHGFEKDFLISIFFFFLDLKKIWWFLIILWIWKRFVDCKFFHGFEKDLQIWVFFCRFEKDLTSSNYFVDLKKLPDLKGF